MGKQQEKKPEDTEAPTKKKIIKKLQLLKPLKSEKDELKDWKPTKIIKQTQKKEQNLKYNENIASDFLSSLPQPTIALPKANKSKLSSQFQQNHFSKSKLKVQISKPTPQQIKWDIQDQSFIRKEFQPPKEVTRKIVQQDVPQEEQIIDEKGRTQKIRTINLNNVINNDGWRQDAQRKQVTRELYSTVDGLVDGKMGKIVKQAQQKAVQIEDSLNRRDQEKKQIRDRYGW